MLENEFRETVAERIAYYRKKAGLTQSQLAEKLNYSDKSVSKWERGEGLPDAFVLYKMTELFGISMNEITGGSEPLSKTEVRKTKRRIIVILAVLIAWLAASFVFFVLKVLPFDLKKEWLAFIYAIPVSFIVLTVFTCIWYGITARAVAVSGIIWAVFLCVRLTFSGASINSMLIMCAVFQVMVILWFYMRNRIKKSVRKFEMPEKTEETDNKEE